jgi:hypothetical protein
MGDVKDRLLSVERAIVSSRRDQADDAEPVAHVQAQTDKFAGPNQQDRAASRSGRINEPSALGGNPIARWRQSETDIYTQ